LIAPAKWPARAGQNRPLSLLGKPWENSNRYRMGAGAMVKTAGAFGIISTLLLQI
jgi:hypothetical protein